MSSKTLDRITSLVNHFDARVRAAGTDKWGNQSPCEEWKARDVVAHVAGNLNHITASVKGQEPRPIRDDEDIVSVWDKAKEGFFAALSGADLSQNIPGPLGPMPAEQFIGRIIATDVLVHTWDLARATGGDEKLDPSAVEAAYSGLKPLDDMIRRPGIFGPRIDAAEDADAQTTFLNFTGRKV